MGSIIDSILSMKLDIYVQSETQDLNTGALKKEWNFSRTESCTAKGMIANSSRRGSDMQQSDNRYSNTQIIEVRTEKRITLREKVTNIRDSKNKYIWTELDYPTETPTVFEVIGSTPITDPFGNVMAYNTLMKRSESQQIGI
jgi:hypothetical protein